jgi:hypothetical protein
MGTIQLKKENDQNDGLVADNIIRINKPANLAHLAIDCTKPGGSKICSTNLIERNVKLTHVHFLVDDVGEDGNKTKSLAAQEWPTNARLTVEDISSGDQNIVSYRGIAEVTVPVYYEITFVKVTIDLCVRVDLRSGHVESQVTVVDGFKDIELVGYTLDASFTTEEVKFKVNDPLTGVGYREMNDLQKFISSRVREMNKRLARLIRVGNDGDNIINDNNTLIVACGRQVGHTTYIYNVATENDIVFCHSDFLKNEMIGCGCKATIVAKVNGVFTIPKELADKGFTNFYVDGFSSAKLPNSFKTDLIAAFKPKKDALFIFLG